MVVHLVTCPKHQPDGSPRSEKQSSRRTLDNLQGRLVAGVQLLAGGNFTAEPLTNGLGDGGAIQLEGDHGGRCGGKVPR